MQKAMPDLHKQNPLVFYLRVLFYVFVALILRVVTFVPLAFLFIPSGPAFLPWLSLLCPVLLVFFLLPLRFSFAEALVQAHGSRRFAFDDAFSLHRYVEKLWGSLVHVLSILKWGIPLAAAGFYASTVYNSVDVSSLMGQLGDLGRWSANMVSGVSAFLGGLFGKAAPLEIQGGMMEGMLALGVVVALALLIIAIGAMRNSATRYVWAYASQNHRNPITENRRRVKNRRWAQLGFAIVNLALWVPFGIGLGRILLDVVSELSTQLMMVLSGMSLDMSFLGPKIGQLLFSFFVLYLPFLPLRRMVTAFFAAKSLRAGQPAPVSGSVQPAPEPVLAAQALTPVPSADPLQEEDAEDGLPDLSQSTRVPDPVPAWPAQNDPAKYAPYQPAVEESIQEALRDAPALWMPEFEDEPVAVEPKSFSGEEAEEASPAAPQAAPASAPDADPPALPLNP